MALVPPTVLNLFQVVPLQLFSTDLIWLAVVFLALAIIAGLAGARGVAGVSMEAARWLILLFLVLAVITFIL